MIVKISQPNVAVQRFYKYYNNKCESDDKIQKIDAKNILVLLKYNNFCD